MIYIIKDKNEQLLNSLGKNQKKIFEAIRNLDIESVLSFTLYEINTTLQTLETLGFIKVDKDVKFDIWTPEGLKELLGVIKVVTIEEYIDILNRTARNLTIGLNKKTVQGLYEAGLIKTCTDDEIYNLINKILKNASYVKSVI